MDSLRMTHEFLKKITSDFSEDQILGRGTFGVVYKGEDSDKQDIAVKVLKPMDGVDAKDFDRELNTLCKVKHPNIIKLLGYCNETELVGTTYGGKKIVADKLHRALCFEYMHNGSLEEYLYDDEDHGLSWRKRYKIIKGICEGLRHLHNDLKPPINHLDLKPANILLDENMVPKIADFGLSRFLGEENTKQTLSAVGTLGYLPPEYINEQKISKEFDIYSLGVIIIKIIVGHKGFVPFNERESDESFTEHVYNKWRKRLETILADTSLETVCEQVKKCIQIGLKCLATERSRRPTIEYILDQLNETEKHTNDSTYCLQEDTDRESIRSGTNILASNSPDMATSSSTIMQELPLEFLKKITNGFSDDRKISEGALGTVYKGIREDGKVIAVKKLAANTIVSAGKQFRKEASNLLLLRHQNIQKLLGYGSEVNKKVVEHHGKYILVDTDECVLCYEYAPKGSLQKYLSDDANRTDWDTSFEIIKGICQGLNYLHLENGAPIVHLDLQPSNILLDENMVPKIADFGLSRFFGLEQSRINTINVVGAKGYMAPEYLYNGEISPLCDIYSLGVLILEIITREKNCSNDKDMSSSNFITDIHETWTDDHIISMYQFLDVVRLQQVKGCLEIAFKCARVDKRNRPSIDEVVNMLHGRSLS